MAGEAGGDPRAWLAVDETAAAFISRSLSLRPPIILPPPLHRAPLRPGNVVEIAGPSNSGKSHLLLMTVQSQSRSEALGVGIYFVMIDSIGAFYWIDRASQPVRENKGKSLQSVTETVVHEIRKFLQLQPALVLVTKAPIYAEGTTTANDFSSRGSSKYVPEDSTVLRYSRQEEERTLSYREYMPSIWQSFVTHRINLQVEEAEVPSVKENEVLSTHTSEWVQPSLKTKEKFSIVDDGVILIQ
ncbi:hypothetical protein BAE44_0001039 [Dichanthelium oligosanthes]|uniref:RecA family profile 1 domain-containing protein n=1 Tax=Dichanthelium oligosanthes TaxID=888268 RepID=A0A1E5WKP2_9POAL|nr:hypothetical protein BAE44_0001039 [Dichanthelium oligosanthes]